jgi:hypothetical protein
MGTDGSDVARMPTEAHPTSKLAGTPISDDETVAKMGHPNLYGLDLGHPAIGGEGGCGP